MLTRRQLLQGLAALPALSTASLRPALAQGTTGTAFIVTGFPAGGMGDLVARPLAEKMRGRYAENVVVESRPGAAGRIAVDYVRRAKPDGLTILQVPGSPIVLAPNLYKNLNYDPLTDLIPVTTTIRYTVSLTAGPGLPADITTVAQFLEWAKANPAQANYGVPSAGSSPHFVGMLLSQESGVKLTSVPYKGGAPLLQDLLGGQVPVAVNVVSEIVPYVGTGRLRSLAVASAEPVEFLPGVPTLASQGYPNIVVEDWLGWFLPAGTPMERVDQLNALVRQEMADPTFAQELRERSLTPYTQTPAEFRTLVEQDLARWAQAVKVTGFSAEG